MIRKLLATTALATLVAAAAYGQEQPAPASPDPQTTTQPAAPPAQPPRPVQADAYLASNFLGESVYNGTGDNAQNIGDVNDIVIDSKGQAKSIVVGVGGFLGIGEKSVALDFPKLSWMEANGDRWLVTDATKEQLDALPEFDPKPFQPAEMPTASIEQPGAATTPAPTTAPQQ
jgi:hypothetical protein